MVVYCMNSFARGNVTVVGVVVAVAGVVVRSLPGENTFRKCMLIGRTKCTSMGEGRKCMSMEEDGGCVLMGEDGGCMSME